MVFVHIRFGNAVSNANKYLYNLYRRDFSSADRLQCSQGPVAERSFRDRINRGSWVSIFVAKQSRVRGSVLEGVLIDSNLTPHDAEHQMPEFQKRLLVSSPFATRETIWAESLDVS